MKKILYLFLSLTLIVFISTGCSKKNNNYELFLEQLISPKTYVDASTDDTLDEYFSQCKKIFGDYLDQNGLDSLLENRIPFIYQTVINSQNINDVKNIKITQIEKDNKNNYTYLSCKVNYTYITKDSKSIHMEDYFVFNINKDDPILCKVYLDTTKSSILNFYVEK